MRTEWLRKQMLVVLIALACASTSTGVNAVASEPAAAKPVAVQWVGDLRGACDKAQRDQQKLLMFITMDGCTYCEKMKQQTFKDKKIVAELNDQFVAVSINASKQPEIARKLKVRTFPTTLIVNSKGDVLDTIRGYQTPKQFRRRLSGVTRQAQR